MSDFEPVVPYLADFSPVEPLDGFPPNVQEEVKELWYNKTTGLVDCSYGLIECNEELITCL